MTKTKKATPTAQKKTATPKTHLAVAQLAMKHAELDHRLTTLEFRYNMILNMLDEEMKTRILNLSHETAENFLKGLIPQITRVPTTSQAAKKGRN